jgi:hypothetical protein
MNTKKRRPTWAREIIQDAKKYGALDGSFRESKRPRPYSSYVALLSDILLMQSLLVMKKLPRRKNGRMPWLKSTSPL